MTFLETTKSKEKINKTRKSATEGKKGTTYSSYKFDFYVIKLTKLNDLGHMSQTYVIQESVDD